MGQLVQLSFNKYEIDIKDSDLIQIQCEINAIHLSMSKESLWLTTDLVLIISLVGVL